MQATSGTMAMNPTIFKKLTYEPNKDLVPVASDRRRAIYSGRQSRTACAQHSRLRSRSPRSDSLSYGSGGVAAFHHLDAELLSSMLGIKMRNVPNRGGVPAMTDLISRQHPGSVRRYRSIDPVGPGGQGARTRYHRRRTGSGCRRDTAACEGRRAGLRHHRLGRCWSRLATRRGRSLPSSTPK